MTDHIFKVRTTPLDSEAPFLRRNLVILDGPRCSGKSTTGELLVTEFAKYKIKAEYFKKGPPDLRDEATNMDIHLFNWWDRVASGQCDVVIADRFAASELVMALYTGRTLPEVVIPYCMEASRKALVQHAAHHLLLLPPLEVLDERMAERPSDHRWDMSRERVEPLWLLALKLLPGVQLERSVDRSTIIGKIINQVITPTRRIT